MLTTDGKQTYFGKQELLIIYSTNAIKEENAMTLYDLVSDYLKYCKLNRRLDDNTLRAYRIDLRQFTDHFIGTDIEDISAYRIEDFISTLHSKYKPKSVKRKVASVKAFYNFLEYRDILTSNPFSKIKVQFREPLTLPKIIPLTSVEAILKAAYTEKIFGSTHIRRDKSLRDIAMLEMLFATGIRISELCSLSTDSVDLTNKTVLIHGKGAKERMLHIENTSTLSALYDYYTAYQEAILKCNFFFANRNGTPLSDQSARRIINHYTELACIHQHITPHMFRHTFASSLLDAGVDIRYIQELLGHSSITVTQIYTHVSMSKQKEILSTKHPRNHFEI